MKTRLCGLLFSISCLALLLPTAFGGEGATKPMRKTVRAEDGLNIVCEDRGKGQTTLVFLHGWCGDHEYWKHQVDVFAADYRVVTLDQAGHGASGKDRKSWSFSSLASDVEAVAKALDLRRVILIGHSMGGLVALMAAKRMPDIVIAVIGVDTIQNVELKIPEDFKKPFLEGFRSDFKGATRKGFPGYLPEKADPELKKWLVTKAEEQDPKMAVGLLQDLLSLDTKMLSKDAKKPVRCINSRGPYLFYTPTAVAINKKYADYSAVLIDGVGHYPMLEKPAEFNQKLRLVLKEFAAKR